ncbi:MAG: alpha/beta hydrolase [Pseudolysinimonas sp.]
MTPAARVLRDVVFAEHPGFRPVSLDLHLPASEGPHLVVLQLHGGGWRVGTRAVFTPLVSEARSFGRITAAGLAVVAADYRLSGEATFPAQVDDVERALDWIAEHGPQHGLDPQRVVLWGGSAGGTLAALTAFRHPDRVRGVIDWYGVSDLLAMATKDATAGSREALWLGAPAADIPEVAIAASPVRQVAPDSPPFLLAHGADDTDVPASQSESLAAALVAAGVSAELHVIPNVGHFWREADEEVTDRIFDEAIDFALKVTSSTFA